MRVIAATNRDLAEEVRMGRFRRDLYYRLNVFPITMPALRDRRDDIPMLTRHLVEKYSRQMRKAIDVIPARVFRLFEAYDWPGNVRELENVIQRAVILSKNGVLDVEEAWCPQQEVRREWASTLLVDVERQHVLSMLNNCRWRIEGQGGAAQVLGLRPSTLRSRMAKLGVTRPSQAAVTA